MWAQLETKTNGNIDSDNLATGWTTWASVTLTKDVTHYLGLTSSATVKYVTSSNDLVFGFEGIARNTYFKIAGTTIMTITSTGDVEISKDVYFDTSPTTFPMSYLLTYCKPVLVYVDSTTIDVEQNTTTANNTLIMMGYGPISVTENTSSTSKFRRLKLSEYANGYDASHTGAANSGIRLGLSLTSNTWYFVYAVRVQGGDDAETPKFILVGDTIDPDPSNWSTLDGHYGDDDWVYLGLFRYGFGTGSITTLVPFVQDKSGWHNFIGVRDTDCFFGIQTVGTTVNSTAYVTKQTYSVGNSGSGSVPATCSQFAVAFKILAEGSELVGNYVITDSSGVDFWQMQSYGPNLEIDEYHGFQLKIPNVGCLARFCTGTP
jgi:hypothetical protein